MPFQMKLTALGAAKIAAAQAGGAAVSLSHFAVGDGSGAAVPAPTGAETALVNERYRTALSSVAVSGTDNQVIIAEGIVQSDQGGWAIRELGIFEAGGALFAYGNFPETYKPVAAEGSSREMVLQASIRVASASAVTMVYDPSLVLATRSWVLSQLPSQVPAGTTAQYWRGNKQWYDFNTSVRAATLSGLSTASAALVTNGDTVLGAIGKLQAQITDRAGAGTIEIRTGSGGWTVPAGVTKVRVTLIGGGGSGAQSGSGEVSGAGGAGGVVIGTLNVVPGSSLFCTIGAGGAATTATVGAEAGKPGGNTTISGSGMTAGGGAGGAATIASATSPGGVATGGVINIPGGASASESTDGQISIGGGNPFCTPGKATRAGSSALGTGYGFGGASGFGSDQTSQAGGPGAIIFEY